MLLQYLSEGRLWTTEGLDGQCDFSYWTPYENVESLHEPTRGGTHSQLIMIIHGLNDLI